MAGDVDVRHDIQRHHSRKIYCCALRTPNRLFVYYVPTVEFSSDALPGAMPEGDAMIPDGADMLFSFIVILTDECDIVIWL